MPKCAADCRPGIDAADITVRNIAGDVALTGTVPSYPQYLQAAAAARRVAGVTGMHNQLEVVLPEGDYRDNVKLTTAWWSTSATNSRSPADLHHGFRGGPPQDRFADLGGHHDRQGYGGADQPLRDAERGGLHHGVEDAQGG